MTDVSPPTNGNNAPLGEGRRSGQARRRPRPRPEPSRESRFIGYLILGFGALALISVLIIALSGSSLDIDEDVADEKTAASLQQTIDSAPPQIATSSNARAARDRLVIPREKSIQESQIAGGWQAQIGQYVAVVQIKNGAFQIILASSEPGMSRLYSSGTYRIIDDIIAFEPQLDWGPPATQGLSYERLTTASYPMIVAFKSGAMVWQNVPRGERRIYVPSRSPLLLDSQKDYIVWKKVN